MSVLNNMKGILLSQMENTPPEIKKAITKCINAIDSALDVEGFIDTPDIDEAMEELFNVMAEYDAENDNPITDEDNDTIVIRKRKNSPSFPTDSIMNDENEDES